MSMYTRLVSSLLFPMHERMKSHRSVAVLRDLEGTQWLSREELRALQLARLRALLSEAQQGVPYYGALFRRLGFDARALRGLEDLAALPLLDKATIREHTESLKHRQARGLARFNTGGSSGEPLVFFIGTERVSHDVAAKWRATRWWGVDIGDREIVVWGSPIEVGAQDRVRRWRDRVLRTHLLPAFEMSERKLDQFVATIARVRPRMLFGYPSALSMIARHASRNAIALDRLGIRVAFVTSERLYDDQRAAISRAFGCAVANGYGGRDAGFIAHECPSGGMHITAEDVILELIGADGRPVPEGQTGEIVVTHLATRDFPFIRYRTGDVASIDTRTRCACGRGLPLLKNLQGRSTDFVVGADGTVMHGLALIYVVRDLRGVEAFKIVQETPLRTVVQLVADRGDAGGLRTVIQDGFRQRLGSQVEVDVQFVDRIAPEKSGKYRYVVSHAIESGRSEQHA